MTSTMTTNDISDQYFKWMLNKVDIGEEYTLLMKHLNTTPFRYNLQLDGNRYEDGISLRYEFGRDNDIPDFVIASECDAKPCSVLEMMVALAHRCEEHIMHRADLGDRTWCWFNYMLRSLGLESMTNSEYDEQKVTDILDRFLDRRYSPKGEGGLFHLENYTGDLRYVDIWYQLMWFLDAYETYE